MDNKKMFSVVHTFLAPAEKRTLLIFCRADIKCTDRLLQLISDELAPTSQKYSHSPAYDFWEDYVQGILKKDFSAFYAKYEMAEYLIITELDSCANLKETQKELCSLLQKRLSASLPTLLIGPELPISGEKYNPILENLIHEAGKTVFL